jgi:predicted RNase H-like HicB family nuclease
MRGTKRKTESYSFNAILEYDPIVDGWSAYIPELATVGGATFGDTADEAIKNMVEVVEMLIEEYKEEGKPLPIRLEKFSPLAHVRKIKVAI